MDRGTEAGLSTTLRSGRDDRVVVKKPGKQIPYGDDNKKSKSSVEEKVSPSPARC